MTSRSKINQLSPNDLRRNNRFLILSHTSNFVRKTYPFPPDLRERTSYHCLPELREYYRELVELKQMPFHFHCAQLKGEWEAMVTAPLTMRCPVLENAAENYYIEDKFKDAVVICVQDDFANNIPADRMLQSVASNLISPLLKTFRASFRESVFWWDEIFNWEKYERDTRDAPLESSYQWEVRKMKYFDRVVFNIETMKFI